MILYHFVLFLTNFKIHFLNPAFPVCGRARLAGPKRRSVPKPATTLPLTWVSGSTAPPTPTLPRPPHKARSPGGPRSHSSAGCPLSLLPCAAIFSSLLHRDIPISTDPWPFRPPLSKHRHADTQTHEPPTWLSCYLLLSVRTPPVRVRGRLNGGHLSPQPRRRQPLAVWTAAGEVRLLYARPRLSLCASHVL